LGGKKKKPSAGGKYNELSSFKPLPTEPVLTKFKAKTHIDKNDLWLYVCYSALGSNRNHQRCAHMIVSNLNGPFVQRKTSMCDFKLKASRYGVYKCFWAYVRLSVAAPYLISITWAEPVYTRTQNAIENTF